MDILAILYYQPYTGTLQFFGFQYIILLIYFTEPYLAHPGMGYSSQKKSGFSSDLCLLIHHLASIITKFMSSRLHAVYKIVLRIHKDLI